MTSVDRAVLTLAVGKPLYLRMAVNLARSFRYWHRESRVRFVLATDQPESLPRDMRDVELIALRRGQLGDGFSPKLHLDELAPARQTLFVDADSLCVGPLDEVFDRFAGRAVAVAGGTIAGGEWFGDVARVCDELAVLALPKFNGGMYYVEPGAAANAVYATARALEPRYDALGLVRLRGRPNDELLMAIAMAVHGHAGIPDDGSIMAEPLNFASGIRVDVLRGTAALYNTPGHASYHPHWPLTVAHPRIVHFLGSHTDRFPYTTEALRLDRVMARGWPCWAARTYAALRCTVPERVATEVKTLLRPAYHGLFGPRRVVVDARVV